MAILNVASLLLLLPAALANKPRCFEFDHQIHASLTVPKFGVPEFGNSYESTAFLTGSVSRNANLSSLVTGQAQINRSFKIHFQYCEPEKCTRAPDVLQVLSHGVGFDHSYWDFGGNEYNYINSATAKGYATLSYDRLGVGRSELADPYSEIQVPTQVAILAEISSLLKAGKLSKKISAPKKLVHVGHSFGSLITNGLVAANPTLSDGVVLTGFSHNTSWTPLFELCLGFELAKSNNPRRFRSYDSGYLTWGNEFDNQCAFYTYPFFDTRVLREAEGVKAPFAISELLSFASVPLAAPNFTQPVLMISGQSDLPFCGGDCTGVFEGPASVSPFVFPAASPFASYIQPNAGHALNLHHNASGAYDVIHAFVKEHVH
ncbi:Alpha/Beta hydrolase protein [Aspergillus pseudoustus]|uniref:Alpha/Beta hydrolase protein n=1 Tax=Aspergillus pseudoustus TaxID=1810923 RepID=A0ABR4JGU0_9EURO